MGLVEMLAAEAQSSPARTYREIWFEFENWERSRGFRDDPSHPSKVALDWVRDLYELDAAINDFEGPTQVAACHAATESLFVAFTQLQHHSELEQAFALWQQARASDNSASDVTIGST